MSMLEEAARVSDAVDGVRNADYGHPIQNFATIAALWSAAFGREFSREDVALAMILLKVARLCGPQQTHRDSWVDIAGYVNCVDAIHEANGAPKTMEELTRQYMREHQAERQEQVRERHDIMLDERLNRPVPAGWRPIATAPTDGTEVEVLIDEREGLLPIRAKASYHPDAGWTMDEIRWILYWRPLDDQHPPDRPLASHCPDGGACRHKCGLGPCQGT